MSGVKLNDLSLVKTSQQTASSASPASQQANPVEQGAPRFHGTISEVPQTAVKPSEEVADSIQASQKDVKEAVAKLNDYVQSIQRDLTFNFDDSTGKTIITVLDRRTKEVVRQIPDELALRLARDLQQDEPLSLFNMKV